MGIPDVLGYQMKDAMSLLKKSGYQVSVVFSKPPRGNPDGQQRVVKSKPVGPKELLLTVVSEEKGKGGVLNGLQNH